MEDEDDEKYCETCGCLLVVRNLWNEQGWYENMYGCNNSNCENFVGVVDPED